ncbi:restriction endonuclease subunit S [Vibrio sp. TRT 21S02]|uniref:restriction endonuclease subunit S n=1 Tax=Vibrio sp. TRT 21S02 TaxID=3418507 RepID=UPI003CEF65D4
MTEQMNVPTLRFGEFDGNWHTATVGQLVKDGVLVKPLDGNHGNIHPKASDYVESGIPFLMASDIQHGQADLQGCKFIDKDLADSLQKGFACEGDVLLTHKGTVGETTILEGIKTPYVMLTPQVTYYRVKNSEKLDNRFLQKLFMSESFRKELLMKADSGTRPYIGILGQLTLNLTSPEIEEQQKIASFLSKVDEKIALLTEKKAKLTEYKKGVMQQLFDGSFQEQDGKLVFVPPTLRFKADDGSEFPDWEEVSLGSITTAMQSGISRQLHSEDIGYPILRSNNLSEGKVSFEDLKYWHLTDDQGADLTRYILEEGDLLVNFINSLSQIGKVAIYYNSMGRDVIYTTNIMRLKFNSMITSEFAFYSFNTRRYVNFIQSIAKPAVSQASFTTVDFKKYKMHVPTRAEQNKMTSLLLAIDKKIELINTELEKAKEWKKGLLQQMFV